MQPNISNHFNTMKAVVLNPKTFFAGVSETEGYGKPTKFIIINTVVTIVLSFLFSFILYLRNQNFLLTFAGLIILIPVMLVVLFIVTAILHVIAKILGGKGRFLNTYQALAYASAISPVTAIPVLGMLASFYQLYLTIIGLRRFHQYSTVRAVINVLTPIVFFVVVAGVAVALLGVTAIGLMKNAGLKPSDLKNLQNLQNTQTPEDIQKYYPTFVPQKDDNYPTGYDDYSNPTE